MISKLTALNLKAISGTWEFGSINVITGENAVGKTALLDAITIDLCGHHPSLGRQHAKTRQLSSGRKMTVQTVHDTFTRSQSWGAEYECIVNPPGVEFEQGDMLSLVDYFKLSEAERIKYLLRKCGAEGNIDELKASMTETMKSLGYMPDQIRESFTYRKPVNTQNCVEYIDDLSIQVANRLKERKLELKGAMMATAEVTGQVSSVSLADTVQSVQPQIEELKRLAQGAESALREAYGSLKEGKANLESIRMLGVRLANEVKLAKDIASSPPHCTKCQNVVSCLHCEAGAAAVSKTANEKHAEYLTTVAAYTQQKVVVANLDAARAEAAAVVEPFGRQMEELERQQAIFNASLGAARTADVARQKVEKLTAGRDLLGTLQTVVVEQSGQILSRSIGAILSIANKLIEPVLGFALEFKDAFGYTRAGVWVSLATLSQSQEMTICAGIQFALSRNAKERILCVDELGRMTATLKLKLLETVKVLIDAKELNQFFGVDPQAGVNPLEDYITRVGPELEDDMVEELRAVAALTFHYPEYVNLIEVKTEVVP